MTVPPTTELDALPAVRTAPAVEESDAIVIGGNLAGLFVAHVLSQLGYSTRLIEKSPRLGGLDSSFTNTNGRTFDHGLHVLDYMRSELVTRTFLHAIDGEVNELVRRRGIVLRDHVLPYDAPADNWPDELRSLLPDRDIVDDIERPTRESIARVYGSEFADFVYDEILASYPSEMRHKELGVDEAELVTNVYPWFFPRATRTGARTTVSRSYHERMRSEPVELMLYPKEGGFGGFADAFRRKLEAQGVEVLCGLDDLAYDIERGSQTVRSIEAADRRFSAPRVYWCAPVGALCGVLGVPMADTKPDWFMLGSFQMEDPVTCDFTELIVGAPEHAISRVSFPGKFSGGPDDLIQVEHAVPRAGEWPLDKDHWRETWLASLSKLGIVGASNAVVDFDFKRFPTLYNCYGVEGVRMPEIELELPPESNLRPVLPTIRSVNLSTRVPQFLEFLALDLAQNGIRS